MFQVVSSISICAVFERAHMPMLNSCPTFYKLGVWSYKWTSPGFELLCIMLKNKH